MNADRRVLIVEARFYEDIADQLVEGATAVLNEPMSKVREFRFRVFLRFPPRSDLPCVRWT